MNACGHCLAYECAYLLSQDIIDGDIDLGSNGHVVLNSSRRVEWIGHILVECITGRLMQVADLHVSHLRYTSHQVNRSTIEHLEVEGLWYVRGLKYHLHQWPTALASYAICAHATHHHLPERSICMSKERAASGNQVAAYLARLNKFILRRIVMQHEAIATKLADLASSGVATRSSSKVLPKDVPAIKIPINTAKIQFLMLNPFLVVYFVGYPEIG